MHTLDCFMELPSTHEMHPLNNSWDAQLMTCLLAGDLKGWIFLVASSSHRTFLQHPPATVSEAVLLQCDRVDWLHVLPIPHMTKHRLIRMVEFAMWCNRPNVLEYLLSHAHEIVRDDASWIVPIDPRHIYYAMTRKRPLILDVLRRTPTYETIISSFASVIPI